MNLLLLEPHFMKVINESNYQQVDDIKDADGIRFLCPVCYEQNKGSIGTHSIICWQPHIPQTYSPKPGRWKFLGTSFNDLTLQAGSSSILLTSGCNAHFYIRNGQVTNA